MILDNNIIAIRKRDITLAHEAFEDLMKRTEHILNIEAKEKSAEYKKLTSSQLEQCALEKIKLACKESPFNPKEVELISGQRFPDIVAEKFYGIEVKSTKENHWTSTGSSIVESTRVDNVDDIYMLFGKLGGSIPEFKCRPYQDVLYDIAVTHSPRYLINMELPKEETIFAKMGTTYDDFRTSPDSIAKVRKYYRKRAESQKKQEMPWWITSENMESAHSFNIRLWSALDYLEKRELQAKCLILFPEALSPKLDKKKYNNVTLWLCSYNQVVNPNVRDMFSAGGKITHVNDKRLPEPIEQVYNVIVDLSSDVKYILNNLTSDMHLMIKEYNPRLLLGKDMFESWVKMCCEIAEEKHIPLREWIETKPKFSFSR